MHLIHFGSERAVELVSALREGRDIPAPPNGWAAADLINAAGAFFLFAANKGPSRVRLEVSGDVEPEAAGFYGPIPVATDEVRLESLHAAIEYVAELTMAAAKGELDSEWGETVRALVGVRGGAREVALLQKEKDELPEDPHEE